MELPPGYFTNKKDSIALLDSVLYELNQGAQMWYLTLYAAPLKLGFTRTHLDHSLFTYPSRIIMGVYVDNLLIAGPDIREINKLKGKLIELFDMIDLGPYRHYLGMEVIRDRKNRTLTL